MTDSNHFEYDDNYPPLCIKESKTAQQPELTQKTVMNYLHESYKDGIKHENVILSNGLSVGEAAVFYFREVNHKRQKCLTDDNPHELRSKLESSINYHFNVKLKENQRWHTLFQQTFTMKTLRNKKRILPALKSFLTQINLKSKGYTAKVREIIQELHLGF